MLELENRYNVARWIAAKLMGTLSKQEDLLLQQWLNSSFEHQKEYEIIKSRLLNDMKQLEKRDILVCWNNIESQLFKKKKFRICRLAVVASVILFLGWGVWLWRVEKEEAIVSLEAVCGMKEYKAVLELSNGELIPIDTMQRVIVENQGIKIISSGEMISYEENTSMKDTVINYHTIRIPKGAEYTLMLSDGTRVWMNSESLLTFPIIFNKIQREVYMEGEMCFEVVKNDEVPFIVKTKDVAVEVLGTLFNIDAYPTDTCVTTTLVNGQIKISNSQESRIIRPDEQVVIGGGKFEVKQVCAEEFIHWIEGMFCFTETRLEDIMKKLSRWYDVKVVFSDSSLCDVKFTIEVPRYENISMILSKMEKIGRVHFIVNDDEIIISE